MTDGEIKKLRQSNDTLYEYTSVLYSHSHFKLEAYYKIISSSKTGDFTILKLERLDTIPLNDQLCPGKQFSIMALKGIDSNKLEFPHPFHCLTRKQLDTCQINNLPLKGRTCLTYFSDSYLRELSTFRKVLVESDVKEIMNAIKRNDFDAERISYSAEELNTACVEKGYNPLGAGLIVDSILRPYR